MISGFFKTREDTARAEKGKNAADQTSSPGEMRHGYFISYTL